MLQKIKGKFLLSSYPHTVLDEYVQQNSWSQLVHKRKVAVNAGIKKEKTEVLTANYDIEQIRAENAKPAIIKQRKRQKPLENTSLHALLPPTSQTMNEDLLSLSELKSNTTKILKGLKKKAAVILAKNKPLAVVMSMNAYQQLKDAADRTTSSQKGKDITAPTATLPVIEQPQQMPKVEPHVSQQVNQPYIEPTNALTNYQQTV